MRLFSPLLVAAFGAALFTSMASANAQDPGSEVTDYSIFPSQVIGQTCLENQANKDEKCLTLDSTEVDVYEKVAQLDVPTHGSRDVLIQFCAKVEDEDFQELECQALVDGVVAEPGSIKPTENPNDMIYVFCMSWFGETAGTGKNDVVEVDVECKRKGDEANTEVNINLSTTSVFSK
jgi:hypothetical protein